MVLGHRWRREIAVRQPEQGAGTVWLQFDDDGRRAGRHRRVRALPAPGEHEPLVRHDLDDPPGCDLSARHANAEHTARLEIDLAVDY